MQVLKALARDFLDCIGLLAVERGMQSTGSKAFLFFPCCSDSLGVQSMFGSVLAVY